MRDDEENPYRRPEGPVRGEPLLPLTYTETFYGPVQRRWIVWVLMALPVCGVLRLSVGMGSSSVELRVRGRIVAEDGTPLVEERLGILLDAEYGLASWERSEPERFGAADLAFFVTTGRDGEFETSVGHVVYHVDYFGPWRVPSEPPPPELRLVFEREPRTFHFVRARDGSSAASTEQGRPSRFELTVREELSTSGPGVSTSVVEAVYRGSRPGVARTRPDS